MPTKKSLRRPLSSHNRNRLDPICFFDFSIHRESQQQTIQADSRTTQIFCVIFTIEGWHDTPVSPDTVSFGVFFVRKTVMPNRLFSEPHVTASNWFACILSTVDPTSLPAQL
ncbi:hypothetical protein [Parasphingorhabdus sp.]|uniref:hypothetical protein n=1 Tax=Parasphingorhabdus sp. TaxID=2709688 RepID=UPI003D29526E